MMTFGTGWVARALGMQPQALGNLCRELMPAKPPNQHHRYTPDEVLWFACFRHARAAGLEAFPAKVLIGSGGMRVMLEALLTRAAPDPAEAVKRLRNIPIVYGARYRFTEAGHETELVGEPLLLEACRLPEKLLKPHPTAGVEEMTTFVTPLTPPLLTLQRIIQEHRNVA